MAPSVEPKKALPENNRGPYGHWHCKTENEQTGKIAEIAFFETALKIEENRETFSQQCMAPQTEEDRQRCQVLGNAIVELENAAAELRELVAGQRYNDPVEEAIANAFASATTKNAAYDSLPPEQNYDLVLAGVGVLVHVEHDVLRSIPHLASFTQCAWVEHWRPSTTTTTKDYHSS